MDVRWVSGSEKRARRKETKRERERRRRRRRRRTAIRTRGKRRKKDGSAVEEACVPNDVCTPRHVNDISGG